MTTGSDGRRGWCRQAADDPSHLGGGSRATAAYVASAAGALVGAAAGTATGTVAAPAVFAFTLSRLRVGMADRDHGLAGVLEAIAVALALIVVAATAAAAVAMLAAWLGSVLGCGLALRLTHQGHARRTALVLAAVEPPAVLAVLWLARELGQEHLSQLSAGLAVAGCGWLARRLAVAAG